MGTIVPIHILYRNDARIHNPKTIFPILSETDYRNDLFDTKYERKFNRGGFSRFQK